MFINSFFEKLLKKHFHSLLELFLHTSQLKQVTMSEILVAYEIYLRPLLHETWVWPTQKIPL